MEKLEIALPTCLIVFATLMWIHVGEKSWYKYALAWVAIFLVYLALFYDRS